jgi:zinc/manganese transport system substrate-binding protein
VWSRLGLSVGIAALLVGASACTTTGDPSPSESGPTTLAVVASTNVYGDIAQRIGGDAVTVTSIISDPSADPHSYEANPQTLLALSEADVVIANGGGYDDFVDTMLASAENDDATVLNAVEISGLTAEGGAELNEHVWYNFEAVGKFVDELAATLSELNADNAATFESNATAFQADLAELTATAEEISEAHAGAGVAITEPVPLYLLESAGLENLTPEEFSEAIEEGIDVPAAVLQEVLALFQDGGVALLAYNEQTTGPETEQVLAAAEAAGIPVVSFTETLPAGKDYVAWMGDNLAAISAALA